MLQAESKSASRRARVRGVTTICKRQHGDLLDGETFPLSIKGRANFHTIRRIAEALKTNDVTAPWSRISAAIYVPPEIVLCRSVPEFLTRLNLSKYEQTFMENGFDDLEVLEQLELDDLVAMGIDGT